MQSMGSFGGTLIGTGVLLLVLQHYGWHAVIPCLCIFVLLAVIPLLKNKRMKMTVKESAKRARLTDFIWFFARRSIWKQIGFLLLYYASIIGILSVLRSYLVDLDYSMKEIGIMIGIVGTGAAFASSFWPDYWFAKSDDIIPEYYSRYSFCLPHSILCVFRGRLLTPNALFGHRTIVECLRYGNHCGIYHCHGLCTQRMRRN